MNPNAEQDAANASIIATMNRTQRRAFEKKLAKTGDLRAAFLEAKARGWFYGPPPKLSPESLAKAKEDGLHEAARRVILAGT